MPVPARLRFRSASRACLAMPLLMVPVDEELRKLGQKLTFQASDLSYLRVLHPLTTFERSQLIWG
jgi:hypothetical protein